MRIFAALPVEGEAKDELELKLAAYRQRDWPVKWVRNDALHVTIKFLGEVEPDRVANLRTALREASAGTPSLAFRPTELGAFPNFARARVLWAGYETETALELMVHRIERATELLGFPVEGRPFRPHVTLGRVREGSRLPREGAEVLEKETLTAGFITDRLVLFESRPQPGGANYTPLDLFPLTG
jgi:2'-5' RNA ligase